MGLSVWQLKRQLAYLAGLAAWEDAPQGLVYNGGAFVSEDLEGHFRMGSVDIDGPAFKTGTDNSVGDTPFCRVRCLRTEWDKRSNASRIERAVFQLWSSAGGGRTPGTPSQAAFDSHGINQVTGANRATVDGQGQSQGRDVDELIARLVEEYSGHFIDSVHGFQGRATATDVIRKVNGSAVLKRALEVEAFNALQSNYYHPPSGASGAIAGDVHGYDVLQTNVGTTSLTITADGTPYVFTAGTDFTQGATPEDTATNIAAAINARVVLSTKITATPTGIVVDLAKTTAATLNCTSTDNLKIGPYNSTGSIEITIVAGPDRFDSLNYVVRRSNVPSDPAPTTPDDPNDVDIPVVGLVATDAFPQLGVNNYAIFVGYAETPQAQATQTPDRYSDRLVFSFTR
jgi:hypothetical protein